nr:hypothetical protein [Sicyoidochytrium minutum DNA virus]
MYRIARDLKISIAQTRNLGGLGVGWI